MDRVHERAFWVACGMCAYCSESTLARILWHACLGVCECPRARRSCWCWCVSVCFLVLLPFVFVHVEASSCRFLSLCVSLSLSLFLSVDRRWRPSSPETVVPKKKHEDAPRLFSVRRCVGNCRPGWTSQLSMSIQQNELTTGELLCVDCMWCCAA